MLRDFGWEKIRCLAEMNQATKFKYFKTGFEEIFGGKKRGKTDEYQFNWRLFLGVYRRENLSINNLRFLEDF